MYLHLSAVGKHHLANHYSSIGNHKEISDFVTAKRKNMSPQSREVSTSRQQHSGSILVEVIVKIVTKPVFDLIKCSKNGVRAICNSQGVNAMVTAMVKDLKPNLLLLLQRVTNS